MKKEFYYKTYDGKEKLIEYHYETEEKLPLIVFFFGGGWMNGSIEHFKLQTQELVKEGYKVALVDYRVYNRDNTTVDTAMKDCFYALKFIGENAGEMAYDKETVFYSGGSAGGHLALSSVMLNNIPNGLNVKALFLFNPVVDTYRKGYNSDAIRNQAFKPVVYSPYHHIEEALPPIIIFHGEEDVIMPYARVVKFCEKYNKMGNSAKLVSFPNCSHGFFNKERHEGEYYRKTLDMAKEFLKKFVD